MNTRHRAQREADAQERQAIGDATTRPKIGKPRRCKSGSDSNLDFAGLGLDNMAHRGARL